MIELQDLCVRRGSKQALQKISFRLREGETVGLAGPNGSGKTTLAEVVATVRRPSSGRILLRGQDVTRRPSAIREALVFVPHRLGGPEDRSIVQHLEYLAALYRVPADLCRTRIESALRKMGLVSLRREKVAHLSSGHRQRLALAQIAVLQPRLLVLDQGFRSLDLAGQALLDERLRERQERDATILLTLSFSDLAGSVLLDRCDRVLALHHGSIRSELSAADGALSSRLRAYT